VARSRIALTIASNAGPWGAPLLVSVLACRFRGRPGSATSESAPRPSAVFEREGVGGPEHRYSGPPRVPGLNPVAWGRRGCCLPTPRTCEPMAWNSRPSRQSSLHWLADQPGLEAKATTGDARVLTRERVRPRHDGHAALPDQPSAWNTAPNVTSSRPTASVIRPSIAA
jgi:hypothetical protein